MGNRRIEQINAALLLLNAHRAEDRVSMFHDDRELEQY